MKNTILFLIILLSFTRCGDDGTNTSEDFDRTALLTNLADGFIFPALNEFNADISVMKASVDVFTSSPNQTTLNELRSDFNTAYLSWQNASIFEFGPSESLALRSNVNTFPTDQSNIQALITAGTYNLDAISNYDSKGLPAMDYLLYGSAVADNEILELFTTDPLKDNYIQFLKDISADLELKVNEVVDEWENGYQNSFKNNKTNDIGSSISLFTNAFVSHYENRFRTLKIGLPAGVFSIEGMSFPELCEGLYADNSKALLVENFNQLEALYYGNSSNGINTVGLEEHLIGVDASDVNTVIKNQLNGIKAALNNLTDPLSVQVEDDRQTVLDVYTEIQKLVTTFKADMFSALSIQITYTDTDGD